MNIKQAAEMFDLSTDTLRYYERVGVIPPVTRNDSGYRDFTTKDLNWIYLVKNLRNAGLSVESLIDFAHLAQGQRTPSEQDAQKEILNEQLEELDQKIAEMQKVRNLLVYKIDSYDSHIAKFLDPNDSDEVEPLWKKDFSD